MNFSTDFPVIRIALAVTLSILAHTLLLWQLPKIALPENTELLPLQAKLEPLPKLGRKPGKPIALKRKTQPPIPPEKAAVAPSPLVAEAMAASSVPAETSVGKATGTQAAIPTITEESVTRALLPKHAQLRYAIQYGSGTFKVGEMIHVLENVDGHYTLHAETETTGLVGIFKSFHLSQTSKGTVGKTGLRPDRYEETKTDGSGTHNSSASFDWNTHRVLFANGKESSFSGQAQDFLSLPYQFSQLPLNIESIPIALTNGKNIRQHFLAIGDEASINTPMGELRTIALHKVHGANEEGLIIWLALEYRLLPVKILYLDKSGEVSANMVITDIRVSDE